MGVIKCSPIFKPRPSYVRVFLIHSELEVFHMQVHVTSRVQAACTGSDHYNANGPGSTQRLFCDFVHGFVQCGSSQDSQMLV